MPVFPMASPLFVRATPKGICWRMALVPSGSRRWLEVEISKVGQRGLLRQQRVLWDLSSTSWDRGLPPLGLPKALASQLEQQLAQLDRQGPSGGWQFQPESRPRAMAPIRLRSAHLAEAISGGRRALPALVLAGLITPARSRPVTARKDDAPAAVQTAILNVAELSAVSGAG